MAMVCTMILHIIEVVFLRVYLSCRGLHEPVPAGFNKEQKALARERLKLLVPFVPVREPMSLGRRIWFHIRGLIGVFLDIPAMQRRRLAGNDQDFSPEVTQQLHRFPEYYRRNFHYQTDGYFTLESAQRYDMQYELIFLGIGQRIRLVAATHLCRFLPQGRAYKMLEVGSGTGNLGAIMAGLYPESDILLTDPSLPYLRHAKVKYPHVAIREFPTFLENLDFARDESLDALFSGFLFHELPLSIVPKAMSEAYRVLKPGAFMLIVDSSQDCDGEENHFGLDQFEQTYHEPYYREFRGSSVQEAMVEAGFEVVYHQMLCFTKVVIGKKLACASSTGIGP